MAGDNSVTAVSDSENSGSDETVEKVTAYLRARSSSYLPQVLGESTATAQQAADTLGVTVHQIGKSIAFKGVDAAGEVTTLVVVLCGDNRVDTVKLAETLGFAKVKSLDAEAVYLKTGFKPGGVCPFNLPPEVKVIIHQDLAELEVCYLAAGHPRAVVRMNGPKIESLTGGVVLAW